MRFPVKSGDIIGFSGRSLRSGLINLATGGIPLWGISHVGIIATLDKRILLFDSTEAPGVCSVTGNFHRGVQAHHLSDVLADYKGRVWHYPLYRRLYQHENDRLGVYLGGVLGHGYDKAGAVRAGGLLFAKLNALIYGQDLAELFCSELLAAALSRIGIFPTVNASRWNPNKLIRAMRRARILHKGERLK